LAAGTRLNSGVAGVDIQTRSDWNLVMETVLCPGAFRITGKKAFRAVYAREGAEPRTLSPACGGEGRVRGP
jgi:hypothetical protein